MTDFMLVGTATTPTGIGVMQVSHMIYPVCGACYMTNPFFQLEVDDYFVCMCGKDYGYLKTCDTAVHTTAELSWIRYAVSGWTGFPEDQLQIEVTHP